MVGVLHEIFLSWRRIIWRMIIICIVRQLILTGLTNFLLRISCTRNTRRNYENQEQKRQLIKTQKPEVIQNFKEGKESIQKKFQKNQELSIVYLFKSNRHSLQTICLGFDKAIFNLNFLV